MMEKLQFRRIVSLGALGASVLTMSGCAIGQIDPPTIEEIREEGKFFELQRPDGESMTCWSYGARGDGSYGESPSWFAVTCDWDNNLVLQSEAPAVTTTTLPAVNQLD